MRESAVVEREVSKFSASRLRAKKIRSLEHAKLAMGRRIKSLKWPLSALCEMMSLLIASRSKRLGRFEGNLPVTQGAISLGNGTRWYAVHERWKRESDESDSHIK